MSILETLAFLALLAYLLASQLGRHEVTGRSLRRPLLMAGALFAFLVYGVPLGGGNPALLSVAAGAGIGLGLLAAACVEVSLEGSRAFSRAGWPYAAVWVFSIGGRLLFGWAAFHGLGPAIVGFLERHQLSGDALKAAFGLMTICEIAVRSGAVALRAAWARREQGRSSLGGA